MAAPTGNRNAAKGKAWFDALRKEIVQRDALPQIARKVVDAALEGELWAIQEIGNRLDGKPAQALEVTGAEGGPLQLSDLSSDAIDARIAELQRRLAGE